MTYTILTFYSFAYFVSMISLLPNAWLSVVYPLYYLCILACLQMNATQLWFDFCNRKWHWACSQLLCKQIHVFLWLAFEFRLNNVWAGDLSLNCCQLPDLRERRPILKFLLEYIIKVYLFRGLLIYYPLQIITISTFGSSTFIHQVILLEKS